MLSASQLASMRLAFDASLPDQAQVLRIARAPDGQGGSILGWTVVATLPCRVMPPQLMAREEPRAGRVTSVTPWTVTLPAFADVLVSDRLVTLDDALARGLGGPGGRTLEVSAVRGPRSWQLQRVVECVEVA